MAESNDSTKVDKAEDEETKEVETSQEEDESKDSEEKADKEEETEDEAAEDDSEESDEEEDESDDDESDESDDETTDTGFKKRFSQLKGDTPEEYVPNLETAHAQSITEGQRLAAENKALAGKLDQLATLVSQDPELAEKLDKVLEGKDNLEAKLDPRIKAVYEQVEQKWTEEFKEFTDMPEHADVLTDDKLRGRLLVAQQKVIQFIEETEGRRPGMLESLNKAWDMLGIDNSEEKLKLAQKDNAQSSKTPSGGKKSKGEGKELSTATEKLAQTMGIDPKKVAEYAGK